MRASSVEQTILRVMSGEQRGPGASAARGITALVEPLYTLLLSLRNRRFDAGSGVRRLSRPVISVGNITAGGTGKTPVVRWLCEQLRGKGLQPAVLLRGYKSSGGLSDEQRMLEAALNPSYTTESLTRSVAHRVVVHANPDRFAGGTDVLREHPNVDLFVLDDAFQHRRLARDFDLVLISATEPFGFGHVHPRGLLREPLPGLKRAQAFLITRVNEIGLSRLSEIEETIRLHSSAPIYHASHAPVSLRSDAESLPVDRLSGRKVFAMCGIGDPQSFFRLVRSHSSELVGSIAYPDHHAFCASEWNAVYQTAVAAGAEVIVTTEKDWVKLERLPRVELPVWRLEIAIGFRNNHERELLEMIAAIVPGR